MSIVKQRQQDFIDNMSFFDDWEEKYSYIIDLARNLNFPEEQKKEENLIKGCQSQVWFYHKYKDGRLYFYGTSDALIVKGLIAVILSIYSDATPNDILDSDRDFFEKSGLNQGLSIIRNNGLNAMLDYIYQTAKSKL